MITHSAIIDLLDLTEEKTALVSVRQSSRAKRLIFKSSISDGYEIVLPRRYDDGWVIETVSKRKQKIEGQITQIIESRRELKPESITLPLANETWKIIYSDFGGEVSNTVTETKGTLELTAKNDDVFWAPINLQKWLHEKAVEYLPKRLDSLSRKLQLPYNRVSIKRQKTRWGSCSIRRNINLNRNIMLMPTDVVDYILHHELVHLKVINHSSHFWSELERVFPNYQDLLIRLRHFERNEVPKWAVV